MSRLSSLPAVLALLMCCAAPAAASEDAAAFRRDAAKASEYLHETRNGENLSSVTLGWYVVGVLADLGKRDAEVSARVHQGGRFIESYLINVFRHHPEQEVAAFDAMAARGGRNVRLAARQALEVLRHIPDSDHSPQKQARDRELLAQALESLRHWLNAAADEAAAP
jgi:hypothetical protein